MESKQSFGAFICQRRKELGMTQKEFARKLFVTDSAVSKWERGLAYPDITLLQSICQVLNVSEKELLSASEDVEGRRAEQLAKKYLRLARNYRLIQYVLYGLTALTCLICNLAVQHTLSWFWIVLASELTAASLTLLPALTPEGSRGLRSLGGFTGSLLLLLLICCLYTGGTWFPTAAMGTLFGLSAVFLPYVLRKLSLPEPLQGQKFSLYLGGMTLLLILLLAVCCFSTGGTWFLRASLWTVFGLSTAFLPFLRNQIPLPPPCRKHKALLYFGLESLFLLGCLAYEGWGRWFPMPGLFLALLGLALPWGWLAALRYVPLRRWSRAAMGFFWTGLWTWLFPWALDRVFLRSGWEISSAHSLRLPVDFTDWSDPVSLNANVLALTILFFLLLGIGCAAAGILRKRQKTRANSWEEL